MEPTLEAKRVLIENTADNDEERQVEFLEHEIECPRCRDDTELCSDLDNLYYVCIECDFCLYTIKRN